MSALFLVASMALLQPCTDDQFNSSVPMGGCCQDDGETFKRVRHWQDRPGGLWVEMYRSPAVIEGEQRREYFFTRDNCGPGPIS